VVHAVDEVDVHGAGRPPEGGGAGRPPAEGMGCRITLAEVGLRLHDASDQERAPAAPHEPLAEKPSCRLGRTLPQPPTEPTLLRGSREQAWRRRPCPRHTAVYDRARPARHAAGSRVPPDRERGGRGEESE
jgi:hypothetical protein